MYQETNAVVPSFTDKEIEAQKDYVTGGSKTKKLKRKSCNLRVWSLVLQATEESLLLSHIYFFLKVDVQYYEFITHI